VGDMPPPPLPLSAAAAGDGVTGGAGPPQRLRARGHHRPRPQPAPGGELRPPLLGVPWESPGPTGRQAPLPASMEPAACGLRAHALCRSLATPPPPPRLTPSIALGRGGAETPSADVMTVNPPSPPSSPASAPTSTAPPRSSPRASPTCSSTPATRWVPPTRRDSLTVQPPAGWVRNPRGGGGGFFSLRISSNATFHTRHCPLFSRWVVKTRPCHCVIDSFF